MKRKQRGKGPNSRPGAPHQRKDGRWVQYVKIDGKRYKRTGGTKREVTDKIAALRAELKNPTRQEARDLGPTLAELCEQLLAKRDPDGSTHRTYAQAFEHWQRLLGGDTRRGVVTRDALQAAVDTLGAIKAPTTVATYYAALRVALGRDHPALKKIAMPADDDDDEPSVLVPSDLAARLQAAAQHDPLGIAIGLGLGAGVRAGEAAALRWQDVDLTRGQLAINGSIKATRSGWVRGRTKSRKARLVTVSTDLLDWLERHRRVQADTAALVGHPAPEFVLADPASGLGIRRDVPVKVLRRLLAAVCTPEEYAQFGELRYHALRHTHISVLLSQGAGVADLAARAGNTPATLLKYYAHALGAADLRLATMAGELFPVLRPEATRVATRPRQTASHSGATITNSKEFDSRTDPQRSAGGATERENPSPDTRREPQEPAPVSNPLSNPAEVQL
jgi:integrase